MYYQVAESEDWEGRTAGQNRADKATLIRSGCAHGYLAYSGGKPIGWCHAAPRLEPPGLDRSEELCSPDAVAVGSIVCFVVAAPYRGQGVAARLLDAACEGMGDNGLLIAEAYPPRETLSPARSYHGPLQMYLKAGFEVHREAGHWLVVRKQLR